MKWRAGDSFQKLSLGGCSELDLKVTTCARPQKKLGEFSASFRKCEAQPNLQWRMALPKLSNLAEGGNAHGGLHPRVPPE